MSVLRKIHREALRRAPWGLLLFLLAGCARSEPFEARLAELQERKLWRSGAEAFATDEYRAYVGLLRRAKDALIENEAKFVWFRDYDALTEQFKRVIAEGDRIHAAIGERREQQQSSVAARLEAQRDKLDRLDVLTSVISVGKSSREFLVKAELLTDEAEDLAEKGRYREAEERLVRATTFTQIAKEVVTPALTRFVDGEQIALWRRKVDETIRESKLRGGYAIVVSKVDRQLYLYKAGRLVRTFPVGLGSRSVSDKLFAGDRATPEGKYRITKKLARSKYYKALLINYPNEEDRRQFEKKIEKTRPKGLFLIVDTGRNRLTVRDGERVVREVVVSCGSGGVLEDPKGGRTWVFDTPRGERQVRSKAKHPTWIKPDWAFIEEGEEIPRKFNDRVEEGVLGDYALGIGDGYFLHGTLYTRLLGRNVTHGCVRIGDADLEYLYKNVPLGTKVYLF